MYNPRLLERKYFRIDDHDEIEAGAKAWKIVHRVARIFANEGIEDQVAVYTANYLTWRLAQVIVKDMNDEAEVIRFLEMMNESNRAYMNDVLVGWRNEHTE